MSGFVSWRQAAKLATPKTIGKCVFSDGLELFLIHLLTILFHVKMQVIV